MGPRSPALLLAVEEAVRAVVDRDDERLALMAPDVGDLYLWTRDYGSYGAVELVMPPGAPHEWDIDWIDMRDGGKDVAVGMWTRQEGRSDLTLELHLHRDAEGGGDHASSTSMCFRRFHFEAEAGARS